MNLSNTELYYTPPENINGNSIIVKGDEFQHITRVMRHAVDDEIYITGGSGVIFLSVISQIYKDYLNAEVKEQYNYNNHFKNIFFCIPKIKSPDRFEFALEKCVELGITNFIIYESERSYKKGVKPERWNKILLAAMKQSLHSYLPKLDFMNSLAELKNSVGIKVILEQNSKQSLLTLPLDSGAKYYFIFGPEGGLSPSEMELFEDYNSCYINSNRLRTETAVISCASVLSAIRGGK